MATSVQENEDASAADVRIAEITVTDADNNQDNAELTLSIVNPSGVSTDPFPFYLTSLGPEYGTLVSAIYVVLLLNGRVGSSADFAKCIYLR